MRVTRIRRILWLGAALALVCLSVLVFVSSQEGIATATQSDASSLCAPETSTCSQQTFPDPSYSASAGPLTNVSSGQAVYVDVTGVPAGYELEIAYCSLAGGTQVVAQPQCASAVPVNGGVTAEPSQYVYGTVTSNQTNNQTILSIPTQFDPDIAGDSGIVSQTTDQLYGPDNRATGTFFCDNAANPCGIEVLILPPSEITELAGAGEPPPPDYSALGNTVIFPLTFNEGGSGCGGAPLLQADASYSAEQFLPAAAEATCTGPDGVGVFPTEEQSVDNPGCAGGTNSVCPIYDVISGNVPVSFTDDPEDPATLAEEKQAGGKVAYIPIAASATEIAFNGAAGFTNGSGSITFPLSSYQLTPAQAAGIMTQLWTSTTASPGVPNDDLCAQLKTKAGKALCKETTTTGSQNLTVETANGKTDNLDVSQATSLQTQEEPFDTYGYASSGTYAQGIQYFIGENDKANYGDTGYALLNPWEFRYDGADTTTEQSLGAMWPSTASGPTFETTGWMCDAPNTNYPVNLPWGGTALVQDIMSGQQILANAEFGPVAAPNNPQGLPSGVVDEHVNSPATNCQAVSTLPIDFNNSTAITADLYGPSSQPLTAQHLMQSAVLKYGGSGGFAFTTMDSSEADFFGLYPASLQNASGAFVSPNAQSVDAALNDATTNADGTISPNFDDTADSSAYPLPMVTYAVVSTSTQPTAAQATELKNLLTNLVTYSKEGGTPSEPLPAGYVPLPSSLASQALTDIANDIVSPSASTPSSPNGTSGSGGSAPATGPSSTPGAAFGGSALRGASTTHGGSSVSGAHGSVTPTSPSNGSAGSPPGNFVGRLITVTVGDSRYFVPALLALALLCLIAGPLLYLSPTLRRPTAATSDASSEGASGPGPPEEA